MDMSNYPVVNIAQLEELVIDAALMPRPRPTLVLSPPGSGKTETAARLAARLGLAFVPFELGLTVPEEVGGIPARDPQTGALVRFPLGPIRHACEHPSLLLIDEVTRADATRQGAAMTGINERRWGDNFLHPRTVVMLAGNEPDSGGVFSLLDALLNRCCVVKLRTERSEIQNYLRGNVAGGANARIEIPADYLQRYEAMRVQLATLWADYSEGRAEMIAESPPAGFAESGALWPSGRAVVHATERIASRIARGQASNDLVALAHASGTVGREIGMMWQRLNDMAQKLPSVAEINANPKTAQVPPDVESAIASLGMLPQIAPGALWQYLNRYPDSMLEIKAAAYRRNMNRTPPLTDTESTKIYTAFSSKLLKAIRH